MENLISVSYEEMEQFILDKCYFTYNMKLCLSNFIREMESNGAETGVIKINDLGQEFEIERVIEIIDEENEEFKFTYNVEYSNKYEGSKWCEVPEEIREKLIEGNVEGEILDLTNGLSVACKVDSEGEIIMDDNAVLYDPTR